MTCDAAELTMKRGDTLKFTCTLTADDVAVDISGWSVRAHVRKNGTLKAELNGTIISGPDGTFSLLEDVAGVTEDWDPGTYQMDIEYTTDESVIFSSATIYIIVEADVTYD